MSHVRELPSNPREKPLDGDAAFLSMSTTSSIVAHTAGPSPDKNFQRARFEFLLPNAHGLVNRYVTSTLGTLGRFRRMMGHRSAPSQPQQAAAVQGLELEPNDTGDLLYVKGDLDAYLKVSSKETCDSKGSVG
jgi:hypothetical protein